MTGNQKIKVLFAGTAEIGVSLLQAIAADDRFEVLEVITQMDKPAGRQMENAATPIKKAAEDLNLTIFQPGNINDSASVTRLQSLDLDLILVFAYGQILSKAVLDLAKKECVNVHASLLPKYRGASPIQSCLINNETETGISLMKMEEKMDTGPVYQTFKFPIAPSDTALTLHNKLADLAAKEVPNCLVDILQGKLSPKPQNEAEATYCHKIEKSDGEIQWDMNADIILLQIRALSGWPGTYTFWNGKRLKILEAVSSAQISHLAPGQVFEFNNEVLISTKTGSIKPIVVQLEGKTALPISEFIKGNPEFINSKLGSDS